MSIPALRALKSLRRALSDPEHRGLLRARLLTRRQLHQTTALTELDRYPQIFSACRDYFQHRENLSILSFGCSTGEEVLTLRHYFPAARITGAEINRHSLAVCQRLPADSKIRFIRSSVPQIAAHGP